MKTIEIKKLNDKETTLDLIKLSLNYPTKEGFYLKEMKLRLRVDKAIEKIKDNKLELEDSDFETLKKCINSMRWASRNKELIEFLEMFE